MQITRVVKQDDGNLEATLILTPEQVAYLINVALVTLTTTGALMIQDVNDEGQPVAVEPLAETAVIDALKNTSITIN